MSQTVKGYKHEAPFDSGFLKVGSIHQLHYEQYGNQDGKPVIFLHGGPGGSSKPSNTAFFNPDIYRVILFDQRGAGQSLPSGELRENTVPDLVSDIEVLRKHLDIPRWHVFGASWGSTLAILYAQAHPQPVVSVTVRGVFFELRENHEPDYNAAFEVTKLFLPEIWEELVADLSEEERKDVSGSYWKRFVCGDRGRELAAAKIYDRWATLMTRLVPGADDYSTMTREEEDRLLASVRIESHYYVHNLWLRELEFLEPQQVERIKGIPFHIVNGRYDLILPPVMAYRLYKLLPGSKLYIVPGTGHSAGEPGIKNTLVEICDELSNLPV